MKDKKEPKRAQDAITRYLYQFLFKDTFRKLKAGKSVNKINVKI